MYRICMDILNFIFLHIWFLYLQKCFFYRKDLLGCGKWRTLPGFFPVASKS